jgi:3-oxoadipate enol-lactonase
MADRQDSTSLLSGIRVPTLVIAGEEDAVIPVSESEAMAHAIPAAQLALIPHAGHLVNLEQPDRFHTVLDSWT